MKKLEIVNPILLGTVFLLILLIFVQYLENQIQARSKTSPEIWQIRSIDTVKYSRDAATAEINNPEFDTEIDLQVKQIKDSGANYIAIDTPYDIQFLPYLRLWVAAARKYNLHVWFRGNFSNWEGWFGYPKQMTFDQHIQKSVQFIKDNPDLFEDGDSFTPCPECENGAEGDPRQTGQVQQYRDFLITETQQTSDAFKSIHKNVATNWLSMNKDVADLVMNSTTVSKIGGVIVIDHYVADPNELAADVNALANKTHAKIILGEFGAPIQGITGNMNDEQQAQWLSIALEGLSKSPNLIGLNYWVNQGGDTELWRDTDNTARPSAAILTEYYNPGYIYGKITDADNNPLNAVNISADEQYSLSENGLYQFAVVGKSIVTFSKSGYQTKTETINLETGEPEMINVILQKSTS